MNSNDVSGQGAAGNNLKLDISINEKWEIWSFSSLS